MVELRVLWDLLGAIGNRNLRICHIGIVTHVALMVGRITTGAVRFVKVGLGFMFHHLLLFLQDLQTVLLCLFIVVMLKIFFFGRVRVIFISLLHAEIDCVADAND